MPGFREMLKNKRENEDFNKKTALKSSSFFF